MITIAVTAEGPDEPRVAISPETVKKLKGFGCTVKVQSGAGLRSRFSDEALKAAGADIAGSAGEAISGADILLKVRRPSAEEMAALKPVLVVPGHMKAGTKVDASTITFTRDYLQTFEKNLAATQNSAELVKAMQQAYPQVTDGAMSLDIGAKVNKGEMKW